MQKACVFLEAFWNQFMKHTWTMFQHHDSNDCELPDGAQTEQSFLTAIFLSLKMGFVCWI